MTGGSVRSFEFGAAVRKAASIKRVVLVGSGKGGVGKSLVACALALKLAERGVMTGILDIDIHGASVPSYLGIAPPVTSSRAGLVPKIAKGVRAMSVSLLVGENPVPVRGAGKTDLISQLFGLTDWGNLDTLIVDLPPSTGDEVLTAFEIFRGRGELLLVTTPSPGALGVVGRLRALAASQKVPVAGVVLNMAYSVAGTGKDYPFGRLSLPKLRRTLQSRVLAVVPLDREVNAGGIARALAASGEFEMAFERLADHFTGVARQPSAHRP